MVPFDDMCNRILDGIQDTNNPSYNEGWGLAPQSGGDGMPRKHEHEDLGRTSSPSTRGDSWLSTREWESCSASSCSTIQGRCSRADVPGVGKIPMPPSAKRPFSVEVAEFFKIRERQDPSSRGRAAGAAVQARPMQRGPRARRRAVRGGSAFGESVDGEILAVGEGRDRAVAVGAQGGATPSRW